MTDAEDYINKELAKNENSGALKDLEEESREKLNKVKEDKVKFTQSLKEKLVFFGFLAAIISGIAYILITIVLIVGIKSNLDLENQITFAILGVVVGLLINFLLGTQGIMLAKKEEKSVEAMRDYYIALNKTKTFKQLKSITYHMVIATIFDVVIKGSIFVLSIIFALRIAASGNGNWVLLLFAFANIGLFTGFGLMRLSKMYDKYIDDHIPTMIAKTTKLEEEAKDNIVIDYDKLDKIKEKDLN